NRSVSPGKFLALRLMLPVSDDPALSIHPGAVPSTVPAYPAIGARATVTLPDGRQFSQSIDGGTGHSGKRAQELHFGLGELDAKTDLPVQIEWRNRKGRINKQTVKLNPGWYTIELGGMAKGA